jgi:hypothetical protein
MTAEEIRDLRERCMGKEPDIPSNFAAFFLAEIAAQLAEMNEKATKAEKQITALRLYLSVYADTQKHPTPVEEAHVIDVVREALS